MSMRLVDILARHLKEWPNDFNDRPAMAITQDGDRAINAFDGVDGATPDASQLQSNGDWSRCFWTGFGLQVEELATDFETAIVTREQWEAAKDALNRPSSMPVQWSGEGLPPVGTDCECKEDRPSYTLDWYKCHVVAHNQGSSGDTQICVTDDRGDFALLYPDHGASFRPIRTPEKIAAEEREKAVEDMLLLDPYDVGMQLGMMSRKDFCGTLYDAGYRKVNNGNQGGGNGK